MIEASSSPNSLWRDRPFLLFWIGRTVSLTGSTITYIVLPILVFNLTGSALRTSLLASLAFLPYLFFGLFAGALADRVDRRRLMVGCDLINFVLLGSIPLAAFLGKLTIPQIYVVQLLSATAFVWFDAANFGLLPSLAGRKRILEANSIVWSTSTLISIVGPPIGGFLTTILGAASAISLDALSFLFSAIMLSFIPRMVQNLRSEDKPTTPVVERTVADIREGLTFLWHQPMVRALTLLGFGHSFSGGAVTGLLVVYGVRALGLVENDARLGLLFTAGALGALLASLTLPQLTRRFPVGYITLAGLFANLLMILGLILAPAFIWGLILYLLWNACSTLVIINGITLRQMVTPDQLQSRVNTTARMIAAGGTPFGAAIGGILADMMPIRLAFLIMAVGVAASVTIGWFSPLREQRKAAEKAEA